MSSIDGNITGIQKKIDIVNKKRKRRIELLESSKKQRLAPDTSNK